MGDWRVLLLSTLAFLTLLAGLLALAIPDSDEGGVILSLDDAHSVRELDGMGFVLVGIGGALAWGAGLLWQRRMIWQERE